MVRDHLGTDLMERLTAHDLVCLCRGRRVTWPFQFSEPFCKSQNTFFAPLYCQLTRWPATEIAQHSYLKRFARPRYERLFIWQTQRLLIGFLVDPWTALLTQVGRLDSGMDLFCFSIFESGVLHFQSEDNPGKASLLFSPWFTHFNKKARFLRQIHEDGGAERTGRYNI